MRRASASVLLARMILPATLLAGSLSSAWASSPVSTYVVPSQVQFIPDEASATKVIIHGAFFFWQNGGTYNQPACGYMYFSCQAGQEAMCRMQWTEIKNAIGQQQCEGFGQMMATSKATLRSEDTSPANPDTWDLGIGITPGSFVGGQCAPALALKCPVGPSSVDMATTATPDLASGGGGVGGGGGGGGGGGCTMVGTHGAMGGMLAMFAAAFTALLRRRRRSS